MTGFYLLWRVNPIVVPHGMAVDLQVQIHELLFTVRQFISLFVFIISCVGINELN